MLGLARILCQGLERVGVCVQCVLLEDDRVNFTVCSVSSAVSQFSTKINYINECCFYNSIENDLPLRGNVVGHWTPSSKSIFRKGKLICFWTAGAMSIVLWYTNNTIYKFA